MKLEKLFEVNENKLFRTDGSAVTDVSAMAKPVLWSAIETEPDVYDESFLASLREELKQAENAGTFVFIEPVLDKPLSDAAAPEQCISALKHCARRIKDCVSVAGFALPESFLQGGFGSESRAAECMAALSEKHAHYVYFCKQSSVPAGCAVPDDIVLY